MAKKNLKMFKKRASETFRILKTAKQLIPVKNAKHDIGNKEYFEEIKKIISQI